VKISAQNRSESSCPCDVLILPVRENRGISPYKHIDSLLDGLLSRVTAAKEFEGKLNQAALLHTQKKIRPHRILLIGLGSNVNREVLRQSGGTASSAIDNQSIRNIAVSTREIMKLKLPPADFLEGFLLADYRFEKYRKTEDRRVLKGISMLGGEAQPALLGTLSTPLRII
jgi:leucyl aminopeptidase